MLKRLVILPLLLLLQPIQSSAQTAEEPRSWCDKSDRGYRCFYGPVTVTKGSTQINFVDVAAPPEAGWITAAKARVVDEDRKKIPEHAVHLHHSGWLDPTREKLFCGGGPPGRIFGTGKEDLRMVLPPGYGYRWDNQPPEGETSPYWTMYAELDGMHQGSFAAYIRLDLRMTSEDMTDVVMPWIAGTGCHQGSEFDVEQGSGINGRFKIERHFKMPLAGRFVWMGAHLHDGAIKMRLYNVTAGTPIYTSRALYEDPSRRWWLTGTTTLRSAEGRPVAEGDTIRVSATYDSSRSREDVMAIMRPAFAPD